MPVVSVDNITRRFGRRAALAGVSFALAPRDCLAIFGPNGAGKTTLLKIVAGLLLPNTGSVSPSGVQARAAVGLISHQTMLYPDLTALENVEFAAQLYGVPDATAAALASLDALGVHDRANTLVRQLSRGLQQRVSIARSFVHRPSIVLLDEPFTGLDAQGAGVLTDALVGLRDGGAALVLVTHNIEEGLALATSVAILNEGRFVSYDARSDIEPITYAARYRAILS